MFSYNNFWQIILWTSSIFHFCEHFSMFHFKEKNKNKNWRRLSIRESGGEKKKASLPEISFVPAWPFIILHKWRGWRHLFEFTRGQNCCDCVYLTGGKFRVQFQRYPDLSSLAAVAFTPASNRGEFKTESVAGIA